MTKHIVSVYFNGQVVSTEADFEPGPDGTWVNAAPITFPAVSVTTDALVIAELRRALENLRRAWAADLRAEQDLRQQLRQLAGTWIETGLLLTPREAAADMAAILTKPYREES